MKIRIRAKDVSLRNCEQCKEPFVPRISSAGRFCSRQCSFDYRAAKVKRVPCAWCGKIIKHPIVWTQGYQSHCCSLSCSGYYQASRLPTATERFWKNVSKPDDPDGCWIWVGNRHRNGYGRLNMKLEDGRKGYKLAHRFSWELNKGPIPDELCVLHDCPGGDNPICVNPNHLLLGTRLDNAMDCIAKGRNHRGERSGSAKLTECQVIEIKRRYAEGGVTRDSLAREHGVTSRSIDNIVNGHTWKHIP